MKISRYIPLFLLIHWFSATQFYAQKSVSSKFDSLRQRVHRYFSKIHPSHHKFFHQDSSNRINLRPYAKYEGAFKVKQGANIFGWHPSWMGGSYTKYNYSLLTHVCYFSADLDGNSGNLALNGWDTTAFVSFAKRQNASCKVLLNVTCFGRGPISRFLNDDDAQAAFYDQLLSTLTQKHGDGVCIDFEEIPAAEKDKFSSFISGLKQVLGEKGLQVVLTLPAVDTDPSPYDFSVLGKSVDLFILMGYDYFGAFSGKTGPVAPIKGSPDWISNHITASIDYYLKKNIPDSILLLGVPYYGAIWETENGMIPTSKITRFIGYRSYSYALGALGNFKDTTELKASYYCYRLRSNRNVYRQFWLDGVYSLGEKYDYVLQNKLGGVAIWALGFDAGSDNLWRLLHVKFAGGAQDAATHNHSGNSGADPNHNAKNDTISGQPVPSDHSRSVLEILKQIVSIAKTKLSLVGLVLSMALLTLLLVLLKILSIPANVIKLKDSGFYYLFMLVTVVVVVVLLLALYIYCFSPHRLAFFIPLACILLLAVFFRYHKFRSEREMP